MARPQNIFTLDRKGFTIIELVAILCIISIISVISITSFNNLVNKSRTKLFEEECAMIYYSFVEKINELRHYKPITYNGKFHLCFYPYKALTPSESGEYVDDFDYENFKDYFLNYVFSSIEGFSNGKIEYNRAIFTLSNSTCNNVIKYIVEDKGEIILNVVIKDANYTDYDTLTITSFTYNDLIGNSKTYNL